VVALDEIFLARPVDDVGGPDEWHPVLGHGRLLVHQIENLLLALHHQTCNCNNSVRINIATVTVQNNWAASFCAGSGSLSNSQSIFETFFSITQSEKNHVSRSD